MVSFFFLCRLNIITVTKNWVLYQNKIVGFYLFYTSSNISRKTFTVSEIYIILNPMILTLVHHTIIIAYTNNDIFISDETLIFIDYNTLLLAVVLSRIVVSCNLMVCMYQSINRHLFSLEWRIEARYDDTLSTWYHDSYYTLYITNYMSRKKVKLTMIRWHFIHV